MNDLSPAGLSSRTSSRSGWMRAVRFYGPGLEPRLDQAPVPRLLPGQALLRVLAAGVCHTELQLLEGTLNPGVWPLVPGHEIAGEVVEVAQGATLPQGVAVGSRALVYYGAPCGECAWCAAGEEQVCPNAGPQPGLSTDGGFAEWVRVPASSLVPLPPGLDPASAAPLGCAAATALHALEAVARVEAGEVVVVYGVGGVGLPLVQLARLAGARVIAVSRSPRKLELARERGAEVVNAAGSDPAREVRRLTRGEGAHVVFELVGSSATMPAALAMLRRQGRLVFVGYGGDRLPLNPLHLVLREIRLLGSLGNTRAELVRVVRLAREGKLQVPLCGTFALEQAGEVLAALRAGEVEGRAILRPSLAEAAAAVWTVSAAGAPVPEPASTQVVPPRQQPARRAPAGVPARAEAGERLAGAAEVGAEQPTPRASGAVPAGEPGAQYPLEAELMRLVARGVDGPRDEDEFDTLARRLFAYQFANNRPYRALCERRGRTPADVAHWREIPAVPIAAFKETLLACEPIEGAAEFNSSGTTQPGRQSRHFHPSLALYDLNARLNFKAHVLPDRERMRLLVLYPPRTEQPHSSLAHWLALMVESFGAPGSGWFVSSSAGLDADGLLAALAASEAGGEPVALLAASFGLVHALEHCQLRGARFRLPPGSRVMDTGGYKGRSREYPRDELYGLVGELLGVPETHIVNMYGMTEHGTQFLDATLREHLRATSQLSPENGAIARSASASAGAGAGQRRPARYKVVPPWARTLVVDPETMAERPAGERGLLLHVDLVNRASVLAVLTEDVGYLVDGGFELVGRAQGAEARGCSIALDELLSAVKGR